MNKAEKIVSACGVIWPEVPPEIKQESGLVRGLWPNRNLADWLEGRGAPKSID